MREENRPFSKLLAMLGLVVATTAAPAVKAIDAKTAESVLPFASFATKTVNKYAQIDEKEFEKNANVVAKGVRSATNQWRNAFKFVGDGIEGLVHFPGWLINKTLDIPAEVLRQVPGGQYPAFLFDATGNAVDYVVGDLGKTGSKVVSEAGNLTGGVVDTATFALTGEMKYAGSSFVDNVSSALSTACNTIDIVSTATAVSPVKIVLKDMGWELLTDASVMATTGQRIGLLDAIFSCDQAATAKVQKTELEKAKKDFEVAKQEAKENKTEQIGGGMQETLRSLSQKIAKDEESQRTKTQIPQNKELSGNQKIAFAKDKMQNM